MKLERGGSEAGRVGAVLKSPVPTSHFCTWPTAVPGGSDSKESAWSVGDPGSIPGWGRIPGEGNGNPLQYSCLENPMNRGAWWATVHGVTKSQTRLSNQAQHSSLEIQNYIVKTFPNVLCLELYVLM